MSQRELASRLGVSRQVATKALAQLADRGFIVMTERGAFTRKIRHATGWRLTEFGYNGRSATKEFMRWPKATETPVEEAAKGKIERLAEVA